MMTQAHWFSYFCPYFSVFDLEKYNANNGEDAAVLSGPLKFLGMKKASLWIEERQTEWQRSLSKFRDLKEKDGQTYKMIFWGQSSFPTRLKKISFPPAILFIRGDESLIHKKNAAIVGSRHPTNLGRLWVHEIVPHLVREGVVIVSGGARGIDFEAHFSALKSSGRSIAFLPGGVDQPYPRGHVLLFNQLLESGALISEFPPGTMVKPENFYRRNRLIAGLADVVVIVEAGIKSGTLVTARSAIQENVELLVVPGPPLVDSYAGSLELLGQGAGLARSHFDVLNVIEQKNNLIIQEESPTVRS